MLKIKYYYEGFRNISKSEKIPHYNIIADIVDGKEVNITFDELEHKS